MSRSRGFSLGKRRMLWKQGFIAADWGTTNRRAYLIDAFGKCIDEFEDDKGILSVQSGGFPDAVRGIRDRLGDHPLLLAGMVGSNRGWIEVPYVRCPAGLADLALALVWPDEGRTAIVPGVSFADADEADVMRGEEVQLLGAHTAGMVPADALVCHPGTHNKWARLVGGRIERFTTVMTGELFNLLRDRSILADLLSGTARARRCVYFRSEARPERRMPDRRTVQDPCPSPAWASRCEGCAVLWKRPVDWRGCPRGPSRGLVTARWW